MAEDDAESVARDPGRSRDTVLLHALFEVQRELGAMGRELGAMGAKLDRVVSDTAHHGEKIDDLRHKVSFVRGGIWVLGGLVVVVGWLLSHNVSASIADLVWRMTPPSPAAPDRQ